MPTTHILLLQGLTAGLAAFGLGALALLIGSGLGLLADRLLNRPQARPPAGRNARRRHARPPRCITTLAAPPKEQAIIP